MRVLLLSSPILLGALLLGAPSAFGATSCEDLSKATLPNTTITLAQTVATGAFTPPPAPAGRGGRGPQSFADVPAFCRIQATLKPTSDSDIKMELWMPVTASWNGKLRGTGNGGLGGGAGVNAGALANGVRLGYATVGNNTGHDGDSSYALSHPEKIKDFGYRSAHEMTVASKALMKEYYGMGPKLSYMAEGGGGTIAALSSAQRYPTDYDSVAVTGMSSYLSHHTFGQMWIWQATHKDEASFIPPEKYAVLHKAALDACDDKDGLKDGIIGDPEHCKFDPGVTLCKGADGPDCLTAPQVEAAKKIYEGPHNPRTGAEVYSPMYPGSELGWGALAGGAAPLGIPVEFFKYFVFKDPNWDYKVRPVNFDADVALADTPENSPVNAVNPDLSAFFGRGGKLLLIDGWADNQVPCKVAINYYHAVVAKLGEKKVKESMRFFMVPGMQHGPGTNGPDNFNFDALSLLADWKENGKVPDQLIVNHYKDGNLVGKRLVCQYPQIATYKGSGNTEDPSSFTCK
jgi:feruloyl esterase